MALVEPNILTLPTAAAAPGMALVEPNILTLPTAAAGNLAPTFGCRFYERVFGPCIGKCPVPSVASITRCKALCIDHAECKSFVYNPEAQNCYLKSSMSQSKHDSMDSRWNRTIACFPDDRQGIPPETAVAAVAKLPRASARPLLLVILRGESHRQMGHNTASGRTGPRLQGNCSQERMSAQGTATKTHIALFTRLQAEFELTLRLHTYRLPGCTEHITGELYGQWRPKLRLYNQSSESQESLFTKAIRSEILDGHCAGRACSSLGALPRYHSLLILRFDVALRDPPGLAQLLLRTAIPPLAMGHGATSEMYAAFPWTPQYLGWVAKSSISHRQLFCTGHTRTSRAREQADSGAQARSDAPPFMSDIIQWAPRPSATLWRTLSTIFPAHDKSDCFARAGVEIKFLSKAPGSNNPHECDNGFYDFVDRSTSTTSCSICSEAEFNEGCASLAAWLFLGAENKTRADLDASLGRQNWRRKLRHNLSSLSTLRCPGL